MTLPEIDRRCAMAGAAAALLAGATGTALGAPERLALVYDATRFKVGVPTGPSAFEDVEFYRGPRAAPRAVAAGDVRAYGDAREAAAMFRDRSVVMALVDEADLAALLTEPGLTLARAG